MAIPSSSLEDSGVLMKDPFLDYLNQILMEEGMDDSPTILQQADNASYEAIFSGFQSVLSQYTPPNSHNSASARHPEDVLDSHPLHQSVSCCNERFSGDHLVEPCSGLIRDPPNTVQGPLLLPTNDYPHSSSQLGTLINYPSSQMNDLYANRHSRAEDAVVEGRRGQEHENRNSKLPSTDEFLSKLVEADLSFQDLKLDDVYTSLYVEEAPSRPAGASATFSKHDGDKSESLIEKGSKSRAKRKLGTSVSAVDVKEVLMSCAQAVAMGDVRSANAILQELYKVHGASANGTCLQRIALFFGSALAARMRGKPEQEFGAMSANHPSGGMVMRASKFGFEVTPYEKILHYFANQSILKVAEGKSRLHIVDYGLMYGMQWPCLIHALAEREGGPPLLVLTGVQFSDPSLNMAERLDVSGRRLAAYAKTHNVPFQYHTLVTNKWADLDAASLHCHEGEVLVVNGKGLRHLEDESAVEGSTTCPRQKFFTSVRSLNPHLLVTTFVNATHNSPFFVTRFGEALNFYSNVFDMLETVWGDSPQRLIVERSYFYRDVLTTIACEGAERVDRPEPYKSWHARITKAGFEQVPVPPAVLARSKSHVVQHYHKDFLICGDASGWMLMGWKGRATIATSAWRPCIV